MMVSHKYRLIFIHAHRTGGTTLSNLLLQKMGTDIEMISQHGNARGPEEALLDAHPDYFTFGFVRNPWDRLFSWYSRIISAGIGSGVETNSPADFEDFLMRLADSSENDPDFHFNQLDYFTDKDGALRTDKIGRFEAYEGDVVSLFKVLGHDILEVPKLNRTQSKDYRPFYTTASKQLIADRCNGDITHFGYEF